jgi:hypothetical protein
MAFIVGAGRSGSTLVYKVLCLHPEVGFISTPLVNMPKVPAIAYLNRLSRRRIDLKKWAWFEESGQAHGVQRTIARKLVPMPREGEAFYNAAGIPLFPGEGFSWSAQDAEKARAHFAGAAKGAGGKVFVGKRIANNRRLDLLKAAFPNARYIHLIRDGRAVLYSLFNSDRIKWRDAWAEQKNLSSATDSDESAVGKAAQGWVDDIREVEKGLVGVEDRTMALRYEDFLADPVQSTREMLSFLSLTPAPEYLDAVRAVIGPGNPREAWRKAWTPEQQQRVEEVQRPVLERYGYALTTV